MSRRTPASSTPRASLPAPLVGFGALLVLSLSIRCAGKSNDDTAGGRGGTGAGVMSGAGAQGGAATGGQHADSGGRAGAAGSPAAGATSTGQGGAFIDPPACSAQSVNEDCPLPASTCAADGRTLTYYSASCPSGQCVYDAQSYACAGLCSNGSCLASTTTTSGSPPPQTCTSSNGGNAGQGGETAYTPGDCPIPPSTCSAPSTLNYYVVQCIEGECVTSVRSLVCAGACVNGACQGNFTVK